MEMTYADGKLTIVLDCGPEALKASQVSKTGKALIVDGSGGFMVVPNVKHNGGPLRFSCNLIANKA